jgi:hypothetical protein
MPTKAELEEKVNQLESKIFEVAEALVDDDQSPEDSINNALDIIEDEEGDDEEGDD